MRAETGDRSAGAEVCCAAVVTKGSLQEFRVLKATLEASHGRVYQWFVRCDEEAQEALCRQPEIRCQVFSKTQAARPELSSIEGHHIISQKMNAMEDAWREGPWEAVVFLDADLLVTKPFLDDLVSLPQEVVLSPHHFPPILRTRSLAFGRFNAGFVLTKTPAFHEWWREAFLGRPDRHLDQGCLDEAPKAFDTAELDERANVGWWRRTGMTQFAPIPADCLFLHVHLYQPVGNLNQFLLRNFALHCLEFLCNSGAHECAVETILRLDSSGWYAGAVDQIRLFRHLGAQTRRTAPVAQA